MFDNCYLPVHRGWLHDAGARNFVAFGVFCSNLRDSLPSEKPLERLDDKTLDVMAPLMYRNQIRVSIRESLESQAAPFGYKQKFTLRYFAFSNRERPNCFSL